MCDNKLHKVNVMVTIIDVAKGEVDIPSRINS